jgi:uncharacterized membrane protein
VIAAERVTGAERARIKLSAWVWIGCASVVLAALPFLFRLDGRAHGDWLQFLGRFHPTLLHLPIGLIVLVPVLEIAGRKRPGLVEAADFVLRSALALALPTFALGYILAYGAGDSGTTVTRHMWGGVVLCIALMLCIAVRPGWVAREQAIAYPAVLSASLLALLWTGHQGGSITHGGDYLTHYMPGPLRALIPSGAKEAGGNSFYALHIHSVLDAKCVSCHGSGSAKASLRVDSYDDLMRGGKDGAVIVPGKPETSMLLARVTLAPGDPHFMPAEGRTPLTSDEISWIRAWIRAGASASAASVPGVNIAGDGAEPPPQPVGDYSSLASEIQQLQHGLGAKLVPLSSKASDGLILRTVDVSSSFGDAQLAQFQKFAPYIVEAELGRTAVSDASLETLKTFTHLRALHLEGTSITGSNLGKLSALRQLTYLNLSGTKVTPESVKQLGKMSQLRHLYLFDTPAEPEGKTVRSTP